MIKRNAKELDHVIATAVRFYLQADSELNCDMHVNLVKAGFSLGNKHKHKS